MLVVLRAAAAVAAALSAVRAHEAERQLFAVAGDKSVWQDTPCCDNGWLVFEGSCYWFIRRQHKYRMALELCNEKNSTLIVVNSIREQDMVLKQGVFNRNTWIGFSNKFSESEFWQTDGGIHIDNLNWLSKTPEHGFTQALGCAAHYNPAIGDNSYYHFHNCHLPFNAICERNASATVTPVTPGLDAH